MNRKVSARCLCDFNILCHLIITFFKKKDPRSQLSSNCIWFDWLVFTVFIFKAPSIYGKHHGLPFIAVMGDLLFNKRCARCLKMSPFEGKTIKWVTIQEVYEFTSTAVTKVHKPGEGECLNNRNVFSQFWKPEVWDRGVTGPHSLLGSGENPSLPLHSFSCFPSILDIPWFAAVSLQPLLLSSHGILLCVKISFFLYGYQLY